MSATKTLHITTRTCPEEEVTPVTQILQLLTLDDFEYNMLTALDMIIIIFLVVIFVSVIRLIKALDHAATSLEDMTRDVMYRARSSPVPTALEDKLRYTVTDDLTSDASSAEECTEPLEHQQAGTEPLEHQQAGSAAPSAEECTDPVDHQLAGNAAPTPLSDNLLKECQVGWLMAYDPMTFHGSIDCSRISRRGYLVKVILPAVETNAEER